MAAFNRRDYDDDQGSRRSRQRDQFESNRPGNSRPKPEAITADGPRLEGHIKNLNDKGFGFIRASESGKEYFFHRVETNGEFDSLQPGEQVTFQPMSSTKGPRAHDVQRI